MKKNRGVMMALIGLFLLVVGLSSFIICDKFLFDIEDGFEVEYEGALFGDDEGNSWHSKDLYEMLDLKLVRSNIYGCALYDEWYFYNNKMVNLDNIDNDIVLGLAINYLQDNNMIKTNDEIKYFGVNDLEEAIKKIFGNEIKYELPQNILKRFQYDEDTKKYEYYYDDNRCDETDNEGVILTKLYNTLFGDDEIVLYERFLYAEVFVKNVYNPQVRLTIYDEYLKPRSVLGEEEIYDDIKYSKYRDSMSVIKYTFKRSSNNTYYFYSSEIVENY